MLVTVGGIVAINTGGETNIDLNSIFGPPIIMIIVAGVLGSFIWCFLGCVKKHALKYICNFFMGLTILTFFSFVYILPYYALEMFRIKQNEEDYNEILEEIAQTHNQTIVVA